MGPGIYLLGPCFLKIITLLHEQAHWIFSHYGYFPKIVPFMIKKAWALQRFSGLNRTRNDEKVILSFDSLVFSGLQLCRLRK